MTTTRALVPLLLLRLLEPSSFLTRRQRGARLHHYYYFKNNLLIQNKENKLLSGAILGLEMFASQEGAAPCEAGAAQDDGCGGDERASAEGVGDAEEERGAEADADGGGRCLVVVFFDALLCDFSVYLLL